MPTITEPLLSNRTFLEMLAETAWADGGGGTPDLIPIKDGDYTVALDDPLREQEHIVGDPDAQYMVHTNRRLAGDLKVGLWPHLWKKLLDYAYVRTSGVLSSKAFRFTLPGVETRRHRGCRVERLTVEGSREGDVDMTLGLVGAYEDDNGASIVTYPGSLVIPDVPSLLGKSCAFVMSLNAGDSFANPIIPKGVSQFTITVENNLRPGPSVEHRVSVEKDGSIEFLHTGRKKLSVRATLLFDRSDISELQRKRYNGQLRVVGAHREWPAYLTVDAAGAVAGSAVAIPTTTDPNVASPVFAVGDVVLLDNFGGANKPCVATITAIDSVAPYGLTVDVLDFDVVSGDHVFNAGFELETAPFKVSTIPLGKAFGDFVTAEINGEAFSGGAEPLVYKCKDMSLAALP